MKASSSQPRRPKVGFLVEGDTDKLIVEALARKVVSRLPARQRPSFATIRLMSSPRVRRVLPEVLHLMGENFQKIILVFDTDTSAAREISRQLGRLRASLRKDGIAGQVELVPVVPEIESWLLADEEAVARVAKGRVPASRSSRKEGPKEQLVKLLGAEWSPRLAALVEALEPERIRARDGSFALFERLLLDAARAGVGQTDSEQDSAVT